jgi:hypothetical protein
MKSRFPYSLAVAALFLVPVGAANAASQLSPEEGFGLGLAVGTPSGISASLPVGPDNAFNAVLGYDLGHDASNLAILGDYVWHLRDLVAVDAGKVSFYYGPGVRVLAARHAEAGIRVVLGVDYFFEGAPVQAFLEIGPGVNIVPNTRPFGTGIVGVRYFF